MSKFLTLWERNSWEVDRRVQTCGGVVIAMFQRAGLLTFKKKKLCWGDDVNEFSVPAGLELRSLARYIMAPY